jgi:glycosyltransferase involved in cell wall biosynthesis
VVPWSLALSVPGFRKPLAPKRIDGMRVAHFVHRYPPALGGAESYFARLSRFLAAAGYDVTVHTTNALDLEAFWSFDGRTLPPDRSAVDGVTVRRHPLRRLPGQRYLLKALSLLVPHRACRAWTLTCNPFCPGMWAEAGRPRRRYDVVHATAFPYAFPLLCARRLATTLGVPFFLTPFLHLGDPDDPHDRTRRAYLQPALLDIARSADRLFVQTEGERQALLAHGFAEERIILQGLGVDLADCTGGDRTAARSAWSVSSEEVVVGHLANNSREKGSVDLVEAARRAWARGGRFRLLLAGPEMPNFRHWRRTAPLEGPVRRLGVLDARGKRDFFAGIDVFALPSRVDSFGLVLPEAWANGVPNLVYRAGGPAWVVRDGVDGLHVRCGDLDGLATALLRLTTDAELRRRLGETGRARLRSDFRWEDKLRLVEEAYRRVRASVPRDLP